MRAKPNTAAPHKAKAADASIAPSAPSAPNGAKVPKGKKGKSATAPGATTGTIGSTAAATGLHPMSSMGSPNPSLNAALVGYARVSTQDQNLHLQRDALTEAGCAKLFEDMLSSAKAERPGLDAALAYLRPGDTLVVWKLDRLGRSLQQLIEIVKLLEERGIGLRSLKESIDTTSAGGKLVFHLFGALAEFERDVIKERTNAGLAAARARGRRGGRPKVMDAKKVVMARTLRQNPSLSVAQICQQLGVSPTTFYRYTR
jgi:DNA invertase Pin-like site-specific DNA recombinase